MLCSGVEWAFGGESEAAATGASAPARRMARKPSMRPAFEGTNINSGAKTERGDTTVVVTAPNDAVILNLRAWFCCEFLPSKVKYRMRTKQD